MQRLINLCYCKSFQKNNNLKGCFEKPTKSNLFIRTSNHAANASPPNQNKLFELTFIIFSINVAMQANLCVYRSIRNSQALIKIGITHFCLIKNILWRVSPLPRGSLLLVCMCLCSSKSNYNTTREHYEHFWMLMIAVIYSVKQYCKCATNRFLVRSHGFLIIIQLA